ncbi:MAG: hypothetical protein WBV82_30950 [Myxococcaceae bacterium]
MKSSALWGVVVSCALIAGCREEPGPAPSLSELKPKPLPSISELVPSEGGAGPEKLFEVEAAPVWGDEPPADAVRITPEGTRASVEGAVLDTNAPEFAGELRAQLGENRPVLLVPDADTFLAQAAPLLAALDDLDIETWLLHPDGKVAFKLRLRDEPSFQAWLDAATPGRIRMIHRADGYELQTAVGKLSGPDPNGPTVPLRGGKWDIARLRASLQALKGRFTQSEDTCIVPSFGMELQTTARALTAYYAAPRERIFDELCLVYPRTAARR